MLHDVGDNLSSFLSTFTRCKAWHLEGLSSNNGVKIALGVLLSSPPPAEVLSFRSLIQRLRPVKSRN